MDLGGLLSALLVFYPIADVGSTKIVGDVGRGIGRWLFWIGIGLGSFVLLKFGDSFADALSDVEEDFASSSPIERQILILLVKVIFKIDQSI